MPGKMIENLSFDEYRQIEGENFSTLKLMAKSALHYLDARENGIEPKKSFALGNAAHTAVLEPREWLHRYIVKPDFVERTDKKGNIKRVQLKADKRMAEYKALLEQAAAERKAIITATDNEKAVAIAQSVMLNESASKLLRGKTSREVSIQWTHRATGLVIRNRLDLVNHTTRTLSDLKSAADVTPDKWCADAVRYHYLAQFAMYADGWHEVTGEMFDFKPLVAESARPHDVAVFTLSEDDLQFGRETYEGWLEEVARCRDVGLWLGVARGNEIPFKRPPWSFPQEDDEIVAA